MEDIFFIASLKPQDYREMMQNLRYNKWFTYDHFEYLDLIREGEPRLDDTQILVDDKPRLEMLNAQNILQWRQTKVQEHPPTYASLRRADLPLSASVASGARVHAIRDCPGRRAAHACDVTQRVKCRGSVMGVPTNGPAR